MNNDEKITYLGSVNSESGFKNFYPQYKLINQELIAIDLEEKELLLNNPYNNINIGFRENKEDDENLYYKYGLELDDYANHICFVTFSLNDMLHIQKKDGVQFRLSFCDLRENNAIVIADNDDCNLYKIVTTSKVLKEDWNDNDWSNRNVRMIEDRDINDELQEGKKYFLKHYDNYVGPLEYKTVGKKKGLYVPTNIKYEVAEKSKNLLVPTELKNTEYFIFDCNTKFYGPERTEKYIFLNNKSPIAAPPTKKNIIDREQICKEIQQYRNYSKNEIYNILICITQGFLTVFAGEPGTGKTSICDTIAKILGLANTESDKNRYLSISVERGWTSKHDLIGYYNPLTDKFTDNTGLYSVLKKLDEEYRHEKCSEPYWVLLDEANLSQMEHYWASFIKLADANARQDTKLSLAPADAKNEKNNIVPEVSVPDTLKFLGTINNDHTTESLSPRLLDRAWVITLPRPTGEFTKKEVQKLYKDCIGWDTLENLFGADSVETTHLFEHAKEDIASICKLYEDNKKIVSPRSRMAIDDYLKVALDCFEETDAMIEAIDFVIMQKLLPMLNGYIEDDFAEDLKEKLKKYPVSAQKFEAMLSQNNNSVTTYVSFFM